MATIRKQHGHYLEDFRSGSLLRHKGGKTITDGLFALFTDFSFTPNPLSKSIRYAQAHGYLGLVVPPGLVMAVVFSQSVEDISENARAATKRPAPDCSLATPCAKSSQRAP